MISGNQLLCPSNYLTCRGEYSRYLVTDLNPKGCYSLRRIRTHLNWAMSSNLRVPDITTSSVQAQNSIKGS